MFGKDSLIYDEYISSHLKLEPKDDVWNNGDSKENNIYDKYVEQEVKRVSNRINVEPTVSLQKFTSELSAAGLLF